MYMYQSSHTTLAGNLLLLDQATEFSASSLGTLLFLAEDLPAGARDCMAISPSAIPLLK